MQDYPENWGCQRSWTTGDATHGTSQIRVCKMVDVEILDIDEVCRILNVIFDEFQTTNFQRSEFVWKLFLFSQKYKIISKKKCLKIQYGIIEINYWFFLPKIKFTFIFCYCYIVVQVFSDSSFGFSCFFFFCVINIIY